MEYVDRILGLVSLYYDFTLHVDATNADSILFTVVLLVYLILLISFAFLYVDVLLR
jgi:hypothetical protein